MSQQVATQTHQQAKTAPTPVSGVLQRKCACGQHTVAGGGCAECRKKGLGLQRQAISHTDTMSAPPIVNEVLRSPGQPLDSGTRTFMESRFGHDFSRVRVHTDTKAAESARAVNALAFTVGQDVVFGTGKCAPQTIGGKRLLAHELTHAIQQGTSPGPIATASFDVSPADDPLEREADRVASRVVDGAADIGEITAGRTNQIQRLELPSFGDIVEGAVETGEAIGGAVVEAGEAVVEAGEAIVDIASEVWEWATELADALGGVITVSGSRLIIIVPPLPACPTIALQFSLPEIGADLPFLEGALPIAELVEIYGSVGLHIGLTPEISAQLGPCYLHGLRIVIDPLAASFGASGSLAVTTALGLGGELRVGLRGEAGVTVIIPAEIPIPIQIPVVGLEAGLAGFGRGIAARTVTIYGKILYSGGRFSLDVTSDLDLGFGLDLGLAGYGQIDLLGQTLCRLYWPLWIWHGDVTISSGLDVDIDIDASGVAASIDLRMPELDRIPFDDFQLDLQREMFADDCMLIEVLCEAGYALGLMPSQNGGAWHGHPTPPWLDLLPPVYPRDPGIASGAFCRGVCGPDCCKGSCSEPQDKVACEETGDGRHVFWVYPNYISCGSDQGCRDHDACYDWCAAGGELSLWSPCHRLCDLECACNYPAHQCVGWIFCSEPYDSYMHFSDEPYMTGGCTGPCPEATEGAEGLSYRLCLPDIQLFEGMDFSDSFGAATGDIDLYTDIIEVPYIGLVVVRVVARGSLDALIAAGLGPAWLTNLCLDVDPYGAVYSGTAELHLLANLNGSASLTGTIDALASWFCLIDVIRATGSLIATGLGNLEAELVDLVRVSCRDGEIALDNELTLESCLGLGFNLDAAFDLELFGFSVISERWNLLSRAWRDCWNTNIGVLPLAPGSGAMPDFSAHGIDPNMLLSWLFSEATDNKVMAAALPADPAAEVGESNPCDTESEPCDMPLPILWPYELPLPPEIPPLQRRGSGEWDGDDRGREQRELQERIREARDRGIPPPSPCFVDDAEWNQVYDAHHKQPLYLNGKDQAFNLCALETLDRHKPGHSKLDNQRDMADSHPTWLACGITEGRLRFHPRGQMYEIEGRK